MKRTLISSAIAAGFMMAGGHAAAQALSSADMVTITSAGTNVLFLSGATAPQQTLIDTIESNLCGGTFTRLRSTAGNGARYQAWGCTSGGAQVVIYYTTLGSNWGVQPVLIGGTGRQTPRLDPAVCTSAAGVNRDNCTVNAIAPLVPDVGVSDVRPSAFVGPNVPTLASLTTEFPEANIAPYNAAGGVFSALTTPFAGGGVIDPVQGVVFGVAVSNTLSTLMGASANRRDSAAPDLDKTTFASILAGKFGADDIDTALGVTTSTSPTRYVVCRRVPTSGTWTFFNVYWLNNGAVPPSNATLPASTTTDWNGEEVAYVNNTTSGQVRTCMNRANASGLAAFGTISAENDNNAGASPSGTANTWSFAKLNGVPMEPTTVSPVVQASNLNNVKEGLYDFVGEVTLNRRGALAGVKNTLYTTLRTNLRGNAVCTLGVSSTTVSTGALQMAGATGASPACSTNWSREGDPFTTPKRINP
jgi:hypothetical protein